MPPKLRLCLASKPVDFSGAIYIRPVTDVDCAEAADH